MPDERYEINHKGEIVVGDSALCANQGQTLNALFSQFNHKCAELERTGPYRKLNITDANGTSRIIHVFSGTVRNEARNPFEKKMQLGGIANPKKTDKHDTVIIGIYVYQATDSIQDAIFVGYPIDDNIRYDTNPSLRGVYVNQLLIQAKNSGFVYDRERNTAAFRAEFIFYYLDNHYALHYEGKEYVEVDNHTVLVEHDVKQGENLILYGAPGCGKSRFIKDHFCNDKNYMERVVFHPDYTYSDFVGQILPENHDGYISYPFVPGPFTRILRKAIEDSQHNYYLVIEELNRGNAPAIFGEVFQLLDRINGESEYGINNADIAKEVYGDAGYQIKIPRNLFILATMNTADQNVFTLDTAFKRRWSMRSIINNINTCYFADELICGTKVSWKSFLTTINAKIVEIGEGNIGSEDKRLGAFFVQPRELHDTDLFSEKVLMYLWNDAFKYKHEKIFMPQYKTLEDLICGFKSYYFGIFAEDVHFQYVEEGVVPASGN